MRSLCRSWQGLFPPADGATPPGGAVHRAQIPLPLAAILVPRATRPGAIRPGVTRPGAPAGMPSGP